MSNDLRKIIRYFVISIVAIRFWIEVVTTTILKNSAIITGINDNKIGYHHYQLGLLIVFLAVLGFKFAAKWKNQVNILLGLGLALFLDQYTNVLSLVRVYLPFSYRSTTDYVIIGIFMIGLFLYWIYLGEEE